MADSGLSLNDHHSQSLAQANGPQQADDTPVNKRKVRRVACGSCRGAKVRCDGARTPCPRCERLDLVCDKNKRTKDTRRSKINDLEKEVQQLRSAIGQNNTGSTNFHRPSVVPGGSTAFTATSFDPASEPNPLVQNSIPGPTYQNCNSQSEEDHSRPPPLAGSVPDSLFATNNNNPSFSGHQLESTYLASDEVNGLFKIYFDQYHPFLPFLNLTKSADEYFDASPLLFWSIIAVAARRYQEDITLLNALSKSVMTLVWKTIASPPASIYTVQALVILCVWPFPTSSMWTDSTVYFSSWALTGAMLLGLHQHQVLAGFSRNVAVTCDDAMFRERTITWSACNILSQRMTAVFGLPQMSHFNWTLDVAAAKENTLEIPSDLHQQLMIERLSDRVSVAMSSNRSDRAGLPSQDDRRLILTSLEAELVSLEESLRPTMSQLNQLYLSSARLYLQTYHFFDIPNTESGRAGMLKAYQTAINLVSDFSQAHSQFDMLQYVPNYLFRTLFTAAGILLKVLNSDSSLDVDCVPGRLSFNSALIALRQCSIQNNDIAGRSADILAQLWAVLRVKKSTLPSLQVGCRMGATIAIDCLWQWRRLYEAETSEQVLASSTTVPATSAPDHSPTARRATGSTPDDTTFLDFDIFTNPAWLWNPEM